MTSTYLKSEKAFLLQSTCVNYYLEVRVHGCAAPAKETSRIGAFLRAIEVTPFLVKDKFTVQFEVKVQYQTKQSHPAVRNSPKSDFTDCAFLCLGLL